MTYCKWLIARMQMTRYLLQIDVLQMTYCKWLGTCRLQLWQGSQHWFKSQWLWWAMHPALIWEPVVMMSNATFMDLRASGDDEQCNLHRVEIQWLWWAIQPSSSGCPIGWNSQDSFWQDLKSLPFLWFVFCCYMLRKHTSAADQSWLLLLLKQFDACCLLPKRMLYKVPRRVVWQHVGSCLHVLRARSSAAVLPPGKDSFEQLSRQS